MNRQQAVALVMAAPQLFPQTTRRCGNRRWLLCFTALAVPLCGPASLHGAAARGWRGTVELPTYLLGPEDPNPPFPLMNRRSVYPYTMLDDLTEQRQTKIYPALFLENEYLKATILPELGGRLYSLYDKRVHRQVFYCNHVVKYGLVGLRGAWISGGIEFNFPNGHTVVTVSPVSSRLLANPDGSATAVVGAIDWVTDMPWEVALTLHPREVRLEQKVTLFNPTAGPHLYWYWANAAVPATSDMQFVYPMRVVNPHSFTEVHTYPVWKGVDYSWYKNIQRPTSLFGLHVRRNFFGAYYHRSDYGVVHVADFHQVPGKKIWSWGVADDGLIWTDLLTDHDGPYNEIQSGRFETQLTQEFMPPHRVEGWTEYWYPVVKMGGGFVEATPKLALNVRFIPRSGTEKASVELRLSPAIEIPDARVRMTLDGTLVRDFGVMRFAPANTVELQAPVDDLEAARRTLAVTVADRSGQTLLHWCASDPVDGNPDSTATAPFRPSAEKLPSQMSVEELFLTGVEEEKRGDQQTAAETYQAALKRDGGYVPVLLKLAWRSYGAMDLRGAQCLVDRALARDPEDPAARYVAGVIDRAAGRLPQAQDHLWESIRFGGRVSAAYTELGEIAIEQKNYGEAVRLLRGALSHNPQDALVLCDLSVALRLRGETTPARRTIDQALELMPLLPYAWAEAWQINGIESVKAHLRRGSPSPVNGNTVLDVDVQNYLAVAAWYRSLRLWRSADAVLSKALDRFPPQSTSPLVYDYLAADAWEEGRDEKASDYVRKAGSVGCDKVFPQRLADAQVLAAVLRHQPQNAQTLYLEGTFLFAHDRYDDAARLWLQALANHYDTSVLERDLGVYEWRVRHNLERAAEHYQRALQLDPDQYRLYPDLDEIDEALGDDSRRRALWARAPAGVLEHDVVRVRHVLFLVEHNEFDQALAVLRHHQFKPWEGGAIVRQMFVIANIAKGEAALNAGDFAAAEASFRHALEYPRNLGVGKPAQPQDQQALYELGVALAREGQTAAAQAVWEEAAEATAEDKPTSVFRAMALERLGKKAEAEVILNELRQEAASEQVGPYALYAAGLAESFEGHRESARRNFRRALEKEPSLWQARWELGRIQ